MLFLFVFALVGSTLAQWPYQPFRVLPASSASLRVPIRSFTPIVPLRSAFAPTNFPLASPVAAQIRFINDAPFVPSVHPPPAIAPLRTTPVFTPTSHFAAASVPISSTPVFAPAVHFAPAVAPLRSVIQDAPAFSPISPSAPAADHLKNFIPAAPAIAPVVHVTPAITSFRTLINDASYPSAAPAFTRPAITTVQRTFLADESGQFSASHTDSAGTSFQEVGTFAPTNDGRDKVLVKSGSYSYTSPDGTPVSVSYKADAQGFHPVSDAIPLPTQPIKPIF